jgi:hypothetical protein
MNKVIQQAFTAEIRNIGLERDNNKTNLQRISASRAYAIKKAWTCIEDDQLKGKVFEWEAPVDTQTLWTSPKKGTLVTCVRTPPNSHLCAILWRIPCHPLFVDFNRSDGHTLIGKK